MFLFWVVAGFLAAAAAGLMLLRAARSAAPASTADPAQVLYRRQLSEIDDLVDRGLMGEGERKGAHAEAGRRLLAAAETPAEAWTEVPRARGMVLLAAAAAPALALGLYLALGAPGMRDQPYADRLEAWRKSDLNTLTPPEIAAVLRQAVKERPSEAEGYRLLGLAEDASQNPIAALQALRRASELAPERADIWRMLGQAAFAAAGGKMEGEAVMAFTRVLALEPGDPAARFYLAQGKAEAGQTSAALADMRALLAELPQGSEGREAVQARVASLEGKPAPITGDPQELAMIKGMVSSLASKLKANPDDPEGWVRLVRAYAVLGDITQRDAAYASARARYAQTPAILQQLDAAARAEPMR